MMVRIIPDKTGRLTQWDVDRKILISGIDLDGAEVHFASPGDDHGAYVVNPKDNAADIPNILLTVAGTINVYIYPKNYTVFSAVLIVTPREKPDDYVYTETETIRYSTLAKQIGDLDGLTTTAKENLVAAINEAAATAGGGKIDKITVNGTEQNVEDKTAKIVVDKSTVGLGNVDNTADVDKPVSTAVQAELDKKAPKETAEEALEVANGATDAIVAVRETAETALERATNALPKSDVVAPDVSAQAGQAADAKATHERFGETQQALSDTVSGLSDELNDFRNTTNSALENKLDKSGGTMTGALALSGAPTEDLHAATKKYVDDLPQIVSFTITADDDGSKHIEGIIDNEIYARFKALIAEGKDIRLTDSSGYVYCMTLDRNNSMYFPMLGAIEYEAHLGIRYYFVSESGISGIYNYKAERTANKVADMTDLTTSTSKYPNCKAVADYVAAAPQIMEYKAVYNSTDKKYHVEGLEDSSLYETFKSQIEAGKLLILVSAAGDRYYMSIISSSYIQFRYPGLANYGTHVGIMYFNVTPTGGILGTYAVKAENNANKVSDMAELTTDATKFPNCKAVADYVATKTKTYSAGTGIQISDGGVISLALDNAEGGSY